MKTRNLEEKDEYGCPVYKYYWIDEPTIEWYRKCGKELVRPLFNDQYKLSDEGFFSKVNKTSLCTYEEALYMHFLSSAEADFLEGIRDTVFTLKVKIIDSLIGSIKNGQQANFSQVSLKLLADSFTHEEVTELLEIDQKYEDNGISQYLSSFYLASFDQVNTEEIYESNSSKYLKKMSNHKTFCWNLSGSFRPLLWLIGFFRKEFEIGTYGKTRERLLGISHSLEGIRSYYHIAALGRNQRKTATERTEITERAF